MVDIDRPHTWRQFKPSLCQTCIANCCKLPVEVTGPELVAMGICLEFDLELGPKHILKRHSKYAKAFSKKDEKYTLQQKANGDCFFLDKSRRCSIYDARPATCRNHPQIGPRAGYCAYQKKVDP